MEVGDLLFIPALLFYLLLAFAVGVLWAILAVLARIDRSESRRAKLRRWARESGRTAVGLLVLYLGLTATVIVLSRFP